MQRHDCGFEETEGKRAAGAKLGLSRRVKYSRLLTRTFRDGPQDMWLLGSMRYTWYESTVANSQCLAMGKDNPGCRRQSCFVAGTFNKLVKSSGAGRDLRSSRLREWPIRDELV